MPLCWFCHEAALIVFSYKLSTLLFKLTFHRTVLVVCHIWTRSCQNVSYAICEQQRADQPVHSRNLISTFVVHCLDSTICTLAISKVSGFLLASVAEQDGLNLTRSKIPKDTFSLDVAHIIIYISEFSLLLGFCSTSGIFCQPSIIYTSCIWKFTNLWWTGVVHCKFVVYVLKNKNLSGSSPSMVPLFQECRKSNPLFFSGNYFLNLRTIGPVSLT